MSEKLNKYQQFFVDCIKYTQNGGKISLRHKPRITERSKVYDVIACNQKLKRPSGV